MTFVHKYMGNNYGLRDDYICDIYSDSIKVGYCKYYKPDISNQSVYIEFIYINEDKRRRGYASELVKELQSKFQLEWDYRFTEEGRDWHNKLIDRKIVNNTVNC